jgi:hypothetical protein
MKKVKFTLTVITAFSMLFSLSTPSFSQLSIKDLNTKINAGDIVVISRKKCPCFGSGGCPFSVDMIKV